MKVRLIDDQGETLAVGHCLDRLRDRFHAPARGPSGRIDDVQWNRPKTGCWDFGDLPGEIRILRGAGQPELPDWPDYDPQIPESADRAFDERAVAMSLIHAAQSESLAKPLGRPALIKMLDDAKARRPGTDGLRKLMSTSRSIVAELGRQGYLSR